MDDKRFDDIVKKKAEAFNDTGYDPHALSDLRKRLSNLASLKSGWNANRTAFVVGSMVLFTLINFGVAWYFSEGRHTALNDEINQLRSERQQLIAFQDQWNHSRNLKTDTIYIYRDVLSGGSAGKKGLSLQRLNEVDSETHKVRHTSSFSENQEEFYMLLQGDQELSEELKTFLSQNNLLLKGDQGEMMLVVHNATVKPVRDYHTDRNQWLSGPGMPQFLPEVSTYQEPEHYRAAEKKEIPSRILWALEKHNHRGVDFQFGLEGKYQKSNYDVGIGKGSGGIGFMTEVIFSPALRLETGLHFGTRVYQISEDEIRQLPPSFFGDYPGYDEQLGELSSLESEAKLVQIPLNLKVFAPLDHNKRWYLSAGLTPQWATNQEFDYKYSVQTSDPPDESEFFSYVGSNQEVDLSYYTTTLNLGLGTEVYLNQRLRWQLGLFYQKGISTAGYENRKLTNSFGIKSSVWFNPPGKY